MIDVEVKRVETLHERRTYASDPPPSARIVTGSARLIEEGTGTVLAIQDVLPRDEWMIDLARSFHAVDWRGKGNEVQENRLSGFQNAHRVFGSTAPVPLRKRWGCSIAAFNQEYPSVTERLGEFAHHAWRSIAEHAPAVAEEHYNLITDILPCWRFRDSAWTSGIVNRTSALPYHRDAGNIRGTWSSMLCLRREIEGGYLHLADLDVWLEIPSASITSFDGQGVLHAVSPIRPTGPRPYRYTTVLYAKSGCRGCLEGPAEIRRAQERRTESEERRA